MTSVVVVDAVRSPIGRKGGGLSTMHPADLLAAVLNALLARTGVDPSLVEQVVGGSVSQVGEQSYNVIRTGWLTAGLPVSAAGTTVDTQCGSSQQAVNLATALITAGVIECAVVCGVEVMSRVPIGIGSSSKLGLGVPLSKQYFARHEFTTQFEAAERIADRWGITRLEADQFGVESQRRAKDAWAQGWFDGQLIPIDATDRDEGGKLTGTTHRVERDEGLRETTLESLAQLAPVARTDGVHTAGTSSQISDAAAAALLMSSAMAERLGLAPRARIVDTCLVGVDPVMNLTGPIDATRRLLGRNHLTMDDLDVVEINEAFASIVLAWARELQPDMARVNPNGGAIALGHPLGATGVILLAKALDELDRVSGHRGLVTMCCGGGLGTGTIVERI